MIQKKELRKPQGIIFDLGGTVLHQDLPGAGDFDCPEVKSWREFMERLRPLLTEKT